MILDSNLKNMTISITNCCNLRCSWCFNAKEKKEHMTVQDFSLILNKVKSTVDHIVLTGGEPFVHPDINKLIELAYASVKTVSITTNGTVLNSEHLQILSDKKVQVGVSIDGDEAFHDSIRGAGNFSKAMDTIVQLNSHDIPVYLQMVISPANVSLMDHVLSLASKYNCIGISYQRHKHQGDGDKHSGAFSASEYSNVCQQIHKLKTQNPHLMVSLKDALFNIYDDELAQRATEIGPNYVIGGCRAAMTYLYICSNGDIRMCPFVEITLGNAFYDDIYDIWKNSNTLNVVRNKTAYSKCFSCTSWSYCRGCRAEALYYTNNITGCDPNCWSK